MVLWTWYQLNRSAFGWLHQIKKRSSCERLLEHLESSSTKIMMRGPVSYVWEETEKETEKEDAWNFTVFSRLFFMLPVQNLSEGFKVRLESFWS